MRAGDIAAAVGLKDVTTGDTLCDPNAIITLERMEFPEPVISVAVEPKTKSDQEKMGMALSKLAQEDPSFRVHTDVITSYSIHYTKLYEPSRPPRRWWSAKGRRCGTSSKR